MVATPHVIAEQTGNLVTLLPSVAWPDDLVREFEREFSYTYTSANFGRARYDEEGNTASRFTSERRQLFRIDAGGRYVVGSGLLRRVGGFLADHGQVLLHRDANGPDDRLDRDVYQADWDALLDRFELRAHQDEALCAVVGNRCGIIEAPTGYGKGTLIEMLCVLLRHARIDVAVYGRDLVQSLVKRIGTYMPGVGQVGCGVNKPGRRVTVYSADSLHLSDGEADYLLADEVHRLATERYARSLAAYRRSRNFGFTASHECRMDGADAELEALFGPVVYRLHYQQAVASSLVVPIRVVWLDVHGDSPAGNTDHPVVLKRRCIWRHDHRNEVIAEHAASYPDDVQVLVMVETIEHALRLRRLLPGFEVCYANMKADDLEAYRRQGLMGYDEEPLTARQRDRLRDDFEAGRVKKAIANSVWMQGVDFRSLQVLVRADAAASETRDIQIPGRVCRLDGKGKQVGILVDCLDQFDHKFYLRAVSRRRNYESRGWEQVMPGRAVAPGRSNVQVSARKVGDEGDDQQQEQCQEQHAQDEAAGAVGAEQVPVAGVPQQEAHRGSDRGRGESVGIDGQGGPEAGPAGRGAAADDVRLQHDEQ